jgi:ceramide glucosyltransferase
MGFAQGKTMLVRRRDLAQAGGIQALAEEIAEDAAATKLVRRIGVAREPCRCSLRAAAWAPYRQTSLGQANALGAPAPHRLSRFLRGRNPHGCLPPLAATAYVADAIDVPVLALMAALAVVWFAARRCWPVWPAGT